MAAASNLWSHFVSFRLVLREAKCAALAFRSFRFVSVANAVSFHFLGKRNATLDTCNAWPSGFVHVRRSDPRADLRTGFYGGRRCAAAGVTPRHKWCAGAVLVGSGMNEASESASFYDSSKPWGELTEIGVLNYFKVRARRAAPPVRLKPTACPAHAPHPRRPPPRARRSTARVRTTRSFA